MKMGNVKLQNFIELPKEKQLEIQQKVLKIFEN